MQVKEFRGRCSPCRAGSRGLAGFGHEALSIACVRLYLESGALGA